MKQATTLSAAAILLLIGSSAAYAQTADSSGATPATPAASQVPADVPPGSWAYNAVEDLASKGLIEGYPPDGKFLGGRALTRYEMATIIARVLARMDQLAASGASTQGLQQQIDEIKSLTDEYKVELTVIGTNMTQAQADIAKLQTDVATLQQGLGSAYDALEEQAKRTSDLKKQVSNDEATAYSSNPKSKFNISGYIQMRAVAANSGSHDRFPQGSAATSGAYSGNYAQGGTLDSAEVRRARLKIAGAPTSNVNYAAQIDFSGLVTPQSTTTVTNTGGTSSTVVTSVPTQQVTLREAWGSYTFGNGDQSKYPTVTAGQFANPFGYILPLSMASSLTPERPLAFSEGGVGGPFASQDYDKGAKVSYNIDGVTLTYAVLNGTGRNAENIDSHFDSVYRAAYKIPTKIVSASVGASYYDGVAYRTRPAGTPSPATYPEPKKQIVGFDGQVNYHGAFVDGEFLKGKFEQLSAFNENAAGLTGPNSLVTTTYVKGNMIQGYYAWAGYTFAQTGNHPLTFGADYDVFQRSTSAQVAGGGNPSYDDVNVGYGAMYNLDKAMRLRLWYDQPTKVSHVPGTPAPPSIGLATAELQVKF